jgi:hypothetical protein
VGPHLRVWGQTGHRGTPNILRPPQMLGSRNTLGACVTPSRPMSIATSLRGPGMDAEPTFGWMAERRVWFFHNEIRSIPLPHAGRGTPQKLGGNGCRSANGGTARRTYRAEPQILQTSNPHRGHAAMPQPRRCAGHVDVSRGSAPVSGPSGRETSNHPREKWAGRVAHAGWIGQHSW